MLIIYRKSSKNIRTRKSILQIVSLLQQNLHKKDKEYKIGLQEME